MGPITVTRGLRRAPCLALALAAACGGRTASPARAPEPQPLGAKDRSRVATADEWEGTPHARVEELFVGRFAGVRVVAAPGGLEIRIRGQSSLNASNAPLFVVDGMPYQTSNGLVSLNPHDVARIEILKDAGQTAFYGVRGANGVVLITTKRPGK